MANKSTIIAGGVVAPVYLKDDAGKRSTMVANNAVRQDAAVTGVLAATGTADTMHFEGYLGFGANGDLLVTGAQDTFVAVGYQPVNGPLAFTETVDAFSAFGRQPLSATLAATEATDTFHAIGVGRGVNGTLTATESADDCDFFIFVPASGVLTATDAADIFRAIGPDAIRVRPRRPFFVT